MSFEGPEFQKVYETFQPRIQRYLASFVGEQEAEDLTQEVFIRVERALKTFRGEAQLSTWIYRIATNAAIDKLRSPSYQMAAQASLRTSESRQTYNDRSGDPSESCAGDLDDRDPWTGEKKLSVEQQLVRKEMGECIRSYIQRLPRNYQTVLVLSELEGLPNKEIAEILGVTLDTVKIRLHRAREMLKEELWRHCDPYWIVDNEFVPEVYPFPNNFRLREYTK
jgi:RNA polymerase sigma-70 factor (ECF subfamily)